MSKYTAVVILVLGLFSINAFAAESAPSLELYPTPTAVGIEVACPAGDKAPDAEFVWRKAGEGTWRNGVDMTVEPKRRLIWASIWPLEQGDKVEVQVTLKGGGGAPVTLSGATVARKIVLENSGGATYYVSPSGSDTADGGAQKPFATLAHGAQAAQPGDTVLVATGVYKEGSLFKGLKGAEGKPIIIKAADGAKPVIDGSVVIEKGSDAWKQFRDGMYVADLKLRAGEKRYAAQDGLRMFFYRSIEDLSKDELLGKRAWFYDETAGKMYVKTGDKSAPSDHVYNVANHTYGVDLTGSDHVVVRGFEVRYCGETCIGVTGASRGCVIYENELHNAPGAVNIFGERIDDIVVWKNNAYEKGLTDFTWSAIKASEYRRQGITCFSARGSSICYNRVDGYFDSIDPEVWRYTDRIDLNRDLDVMYNDLINCGDDAIEADGGGVNMRIHANRMRNCFAAISIAPVEKGPVYVTRNHGTYKMLFFKLNVGGPESLGWAYCYHNSGYCQVKGEAYGGTAVSFPPGDTMPISNKRFANNAIIAKEQGIRNGHAGYMLDYDCYWHVPDAKPLVFTWQVMTADGKWPKATTYRTLAEFAKATARETHGLYTDPMFMSTPDLGNVGEWQNYTTTPIGAYPLVPDSSVGDLRLQNGSPCIDRGVVVRGINEDFHGRAPDIGAFETK